MMIEKKEKDNLFEIVEIPTQMGMAIKTPEGENISQTELLVRMANDLEKIKKSVA